MSEQHVYIYVTDQNHELTDDQKDEAFALFEQSIIECEFEPYYDEADNLKIENSDKVINSPFMMTAGAFVATNDFWQLDDNENAEFDGDIDETIEVRPEMLQRIETILGTKVEVLWEHRD